MNLNLSPFALLLQAADPRMAVTDYLRPSRLIAVVFVLALTWLLLRYVSRLLSFVGSRNARARFVVKWLEPVIRITLWFGALLFGFSLLAPTQETFFAGLASLGIALGLGGQDLVKNLIGGLIILTDRPFQLGDRVRIGAAYGEVDYVGLYSTKMTTADDTRVTIPNAMAVTEEAFNANSGVPDCQVVTDLFLPAATDPREALRIGYEAAYTSPYLFSRKPVVALVGDVFDQRPYLRLRVKAYVYDHRYEHRMQSDITVRAKTEFLRLGMLSDWEPRRAPEAAN